MIFDITPKAVQMKKESLFSEQHQMMKMKMMKMKMMLEQLDNNRREMNLDSYIILYFQTFI